MSSNSISSNYYILLCIFLQFFLLIHSEPLVPALYVFGDSLFENGNNNYLPTLAKANYPPYGIDLPGQPLGRFTNGRTIPDIIAELLGLPYPPPYLNMSEPMPLSGLNYASTSCGILPFTGIIYGKCMSMREQVDMFQRTVQYKLPSHFESSEELSNYLAKSILLICIGNNDYLNDYLQPTIFIRPDPPTFAQDLMDALSVHLERLYKLGARKIIVLEVAPLGCIPHLAKKYKLNGTCHEETNRIVSFFNTKLRPLLKNLTSTLQGSTFVIAQTHSLIRNFMDNPSKYGFTDRVNPCCKSMKNGTFTCYANQVPCPNRNEHVFWDGFHITEMGNLIGASLCFNDPQFCTPFAIKELIQM